jgi:F0F1-type ATP synthase gamma subunit
MKNSKSLKKDLNNISALKDLILSLEELSAMKYRKSKRGVLDSRGFLDEISVIYRQVKNNYRELSGSKASYQTKFRNPSKKLIYVFLSSNGGLFGDVIQKNFENLKMYLERIPPQEIIIAGTVGQRMYEYSDIQNKPPYKYFPLSDSSGDKENLDAIIRHCLDFEKIVVFYTRYIEILNQKPMADSVTGDIIYEETVNSLSTNKETKEVFDDFLYEPSIEKVLGLFENQMISSLFEQKVFESGLSKFTSRMVSLDTASERIKNESVKIKNMYQRIKHLENNKKSSVQISGILSSL